MLIRTTGKDVFESATLKPVSPGTPGRQSAIGLLSIDRLQLAALGCAGGRALIRYASGLVSSVLGAEDKVFHLGPKLGVLFAEGKSREEVGRIAESLLAVLAPPIEIGGRSLHLATSLGVAMETGDESRSHDLLRDADIALSLAEENGPGRVRFFTPAMHQAALSRWQLETEIRRALDRSQIVLHYQPLFDLSSREPQAFEALARWPQSGLPPQEFLGAAKRIGLMPELGRHILREACRQAIAFAAEPGGSACRVMVNLSPQELAQDDLASQIRGILEETGCPPGRIAFEITEEVSFENPELTVLRLEELRALGCQILLDDFGTGFASVNALQAFDFDALKIDRSLTRQLGITERSNRLFEATVRMATSLGMEVVAEGIETSLQAILAEESGCRFGQGAYFSMPVPAASAQELLHGGS